MNKFKKSLMAGAMAVTLLASTPGTAGGSWLSAGLSAAGLLYGGMMTFLNGGITIWMVATNVDVAQLIAEGLVLYKMYDIKDVWEPEPQEEYQQAAQSNGAGGSGGSSSGGTSYSSMLDTLTFQAAALKNVGIEAIGVGPTLSEIVNTATQVSVLRDLEWLQLKSAATDSSKNAEDGETPGAGSCAASYSVCLVDMSADDEAAVAGRQTQNKQNYGTAGIAHAELGLKSVQQAIANDGGSSIGKSGTASSATDTTFVQGKTTKVQDLSKMIGTGKNTVAAMKIVAMMNLELAQRLNQGNMLQGSVLTIEAARAMPDRLELTD